MKTLLLLRSKMLLLYKLLFVATLLLTSSVASSQTVVNSLTELLPYLEEDNVNIKMTPGTYTIPANDISNGTYTKYTEINGNKAYVLLLFEGSNCTYDFTGVKIEVLTEVFNAIPSDAGDFFQIQIIGNENVIKNLTLEDVGSVHDYPKYGCLNVVIDGKDNRVEGFHITTRGSFPYGYGDCFGKGGTYTIKHYKHSAFLIRGLRNHALNDTIYHYSYGHCMFMQGASYPKIEGCHLVGEVRTTDDMLLEEGTGSAADLIDFFTVWGYRLQPGFTKALGEAGIRAYDGGNTIIDGVEYSRGTDNPTILNCYVKNLRVGVTLTHATGTKYVEGVTAVGTERGFATGDGDIVDCYSDVQFGAAFGVDYERNKNINVDITIIPYEKPNTYHLYKEDIKEDETFNGSKYAAYIRGTGHNITFKSAVDNPDQDLRIAFGGDATTIGEIHTVEDYLASDVTLNNYTNFPIVLYDKAENNTGVTGGMVTDFGTNNSFTHTAVSVGKYQAEDYSSMSGVDTENTTDDGGGENVTSITANDYLEYEIDVPFAGTYVIDYRVASETVDGDFSVSINNQSLEDITFSATGGSQVWTTISSASTVTLEKGAQTLKVIANSSDWNFNWFDLTLECAKIEIDPYVEVYSPIGEVVSTQTATEVVMFPGNSVSLQPGPSIGGTWSWLGPNGFTADSREILITDIDADDAGDYIATISNNCGQESSVTYTISISGTVMVEAEDYNTSSGVTTESTTDDGGGENIIFASASDYTEYTIDVPVSATYSFDFRVASESSDGDFDVSVNDELFENITFTTTGGTQTWNTVSSTEMIYLTEGTHSVKITANTGAWNLNWLKLVGHDYVSPCNLPLLHNGFEVKNEVVSWTTGLLDISCVSTVNVYAELSQMGSLTSSDHLNVYYRIDGGDLVPLSENTGSIGESTVIIRELSGTTIEVIIEGESTSADNYYTVNKICVVETTDPFARIEAEDYDAMEGVNNNGSRLGSINPGNWSMYAGLDLTGAKSIDVSVGTVYSDAYIEVRLGATDGTLIATVPVPNTGGYNTYRTASIYIDEVTGIYDVYLVYQTVTSANVCNIDWLQFSETEIKRPTNPYERFEAEINDGESGTTVVSTSDVDGDEELSDLKDGDYIIYSALDIEEAVGIDMRVASAIDGGVIEVRLGSKNGQIISFIDVPNTGNITTWQTVNSRIDEIQGENDIYFVFRGEGEDLFRLNWCQFIKSDNAFSRLESEEYDEGSKSFTVVDAGDIDGGSALRLVYPGDWVMFSDVDLTDAKSINTRYVTSYTDAFIEVRLDASDGDLIGTINLRPTESWTAWASISANISEVVGTHDVYFVYQTETSSLVCNSNWFQFSTEEVDETIEALSRIEAESYFRAFGTETTTTTDTDGEEEVNFSQNNEWLLFKNVDMTEAVTVDLRVASQSGGLLYLYSGAYDGSYLSVVSVPSTGSLMDWETISGNLLLEGEGVKDIYVILKGAEGKMININWLQFRSKATSVDKEISYSDINIYPNPVSDFLNIENAEGAKVEIYSTGGQLVLQAILSNYNETINLNKLNQGSYIVKVTKKDSVTTKKILKK